MPVTVSSTPNPNAAKFTVGVPVGGLDAQLDEAAYLANLRSGLEKDEVVTTAELELLADQDVVDALGEAKIRESFDLEYHLKHVDTVFKRVFGE